MIRPSAGMARSQTPSQTAYLGLQEIRSAPLVSATSTTASADRHPSGPDSSMDSGNSRRLTSTVLSRIDETGRRCYSIYSMVNCLGGMS